MQDEFLPPSNSLNFVSIQRNPKPTKIIEWWTNDYIMYFPTWVIFFFSYPFNLFFHYSPLGHLQIKYTCMHFLQLLYIFVLFGQWTMTSTFYLLTFSNIFFNKFSIISLSHLNIIYSFFNNYTYSNIFLFNS